MKEIVLPEGFEVDRIENNKIILKESNPLPTTWEEYCDIVGVDINFPNYFILDTNIPKKQIPLGLIAFIKLLKLRDCYRRGIN